MASPFLAAILLIASVIVAIIGIYGAWVGVISTRWPSVEGVLDSYSIHKCAMEENSQSRYRADLYISFFTNGRRFRTQKKTSKQPSRASVKAEIQRKYPDKKINLYYNPHFPRQSVLEPGVEWYWLFFPIIAFFLLCGGYLTYSWPFTAGFLIAIIVGGAAVLNFFVAFGGYYYPDANIWDDVQDWLETYIFGPPPSSPSAISSIRRRQNKKPGRPSSGQAASQLTETPKYPSIRERNAEMVQLHDEGATLTSLATQFDMTPTTAATILRSQGRQVRESDQDEAFLANIAEIEQETGTSLQKTIKPSSDRQLARSIPKLAEKPKKDNICPKCNSQNSPRAIFCTRCGTKIAKDHSLPTQTESPESFEEEVPGEGGIADHAVDKAALSHETRRIDAVLQPVSASEHPGQESSVEIVSKGTFDLIDKEDSFESLEEEIVTESTAPAVLSPSELSSEPIAELPIRELVSEEKLSLFSSIQYQIREVIIEQGETGSIIRITPSSGTISQITAEFYQDQVLMRGCFQNATLSQVSLELRIDEEPRRLAGLDPWTNITLSGEERFLSRLRFRRGIARRMVTLGRALVKVDSHGRGKVCIEVGCNENEKAIKQAYALMKDLQSFVEYSLCS